MAIYERIQNTVEAVRFTHANWETAINFAKEKTAVTLVPQEGLSIASSFQEDETAKIGDWLVWNGVRMNAITNDEFVKHYKRRIPRKAKDDAAPAAKKKVKAA